MTNFVKMNNAWTGMQPAVKKPTGFATSQLTVKDEVWIVDKDSSLIIRINASVATVLTFRINASLGQGIPTSIRRLDTNAQLSKTATTYIFPSGSYDVEITMDALDSPHITSNNLIITHILSLANYKGSTFPTLRAIALTSVPTSIPKTITSLASAFEGCSNFNGPVVFDTSNVTNMSDMFYDCTAFNSPVTLNTENVTNMSYMFSNCTVFNQPIDFNTSKVTNMSYMFTNCTVFNSPLLFSDTSKVTDFSGMFYYCSNFNSVNLSGWNTTAATSWTNFRLGSGMPSSHVPAKFR